MSAAGVALFGRTLTWPRNDFHLFGGNGELAPLADQPGSQVSAATRALREPGGPADPPDARHPIA
jgi:hypothetical protein